MPFDLCWSALFFILKSCHLFACWSSATYADFHDSFVVVVRKIRTKQPGRGVGLAEILAIRQRSQTYSPIGRALRPSPIVCSFGRFWTFTTYFAPLHHQSRKASDTGSVRARGYTPQPAHCFASMDNDPSPYPGLRADATSSVPAKRGWDGPAVRQKTKVTRACDLCKAKKSKCSGEQPCASCDRRGLNCQYEATYSRGKPPFPRRLDRASNELSDGPLGAMQYRSPNGSDGAGQNLESNGLNMSLPALVPRLVESTEIIQGAPSPASISLENAPEVPSRASPGLEVAGQYSDPTSGLSFLHRAWRRISKDENSQVMTGQLGSSDDDQLLTCAGDKPFQKPNKVYMPSPNQGRALLELYFDVCIATYRILHR